MRRSNTVLDNLILTNIESIWKVHEVHAGAAQAVAGRAERRDVAELGHEIVIAMNGALTRNSIEQTFGGEGRGGHGDDGVDAVAPDLHAPRT